MGLPSNNFFYYLPNNEQQLGNLLTNLYFFVYNANKEDLILIKANI